MRRWVFSLYPSPTLLRLSPFCRGPPAHPATSRVLRSHRLHPALLRASRSRFPAVRQFGTEPQPRPEPKPRPNAGLEPTSAARSRFRPPRPVRRSSRLRLRRQSLHTATIRRPVTSNPITARKAVASPTATATDQTRPDPSRNPDRTLDLRCTQPLPAPTTRPPVLPPPPSSAAPAHSNHPPARNLLPDYRPESCRLAHSHSPDPSRAGTQTERRTGAGPPLHAAASGSHDPSAGPPASIPQPDYTIKGHS